LINSLSLPLNLSLKSLKQRKSSKSLKKEKTDGLIDEYKEKEGSNERLQNGCLMLLIKIRDSRLRGVQIHLLIYFP
jgi:hypothetical protein